VNLYFFFFYTNLAFFLGTTSILARQRLPMPGPTPFVVDNRPFRPAPWLQACHVARFDTAARCPPLPRPIG
jgi:hypothetical protein